MHTILQSQINKFFADPQKYPQDLTNWTAFLQAISETYEQFEQDRKAIEHSLEESSKGLNEKNEKLQESSALLSQKIVEVELEKARDDAIIRSIGEGIVLTDAQGKILVVNTVAENLIENTAIELKSKTLFDAFKLVDKEKNIISADRYPIAIALQTGEKAEGVFTFHRKDDSNIFLNISANPVIQGEKVIGAIAIMRDITEQKEIDRMKTEFISLASHQLRTPLSAIRWFSEMLLSGDAGKMNPEQEDFSRNIYDSIERMIGLVNALLNISRIESGRIMIQPIPTKLDEMVKGLLKELEQSLIKKDLHAIVSVHENLPTINLDTRLIRQVYMNLLTNAIKYTENGGDITIIISRKGEEIITQVSDTGYGIPKLQQGKIFQKFFRADNAAKKETDGTGLGLYLAKTIIESSQGKIWFESEEGKGTTFWFSLPVSGMIAKKGEVTLDE